MLDRNPGVGPLRSSLPRGNDQRGGFEACSGVSQVCACMHSYSSVLFTVFIFASKYTEPRGLLRLSPRFFFSLLSFFFTKVLADGDEKRREQKSEKFPLLRAE